MNQSLVMELVLVLVLGGTVVWLQICSYARIRTYCRRCRSGLEANNEDTFEWLRWLRQNGIWPLSGVHASAAREMALDALENRVWHYKDYLLLQRLGVCSPLIGMFLSAAGFFLLSFLDSSAFRNAHAANSGAAADDFQNIMFRLSPLIIGVLTGAGLALLNQIFLHLASVALTALQQRAHDWYDSTVWLPAIEHGDDPMNEAADAMAKAADSIKTTSEKMEQANTLFLTGVERLSDQIETVEKAADSARRSFENHATTFGSMTSAVEASLQRLANLGKTAGDIEHAGMQLRMSSEGLHEAQQVFSSGVKDAREAFEVGRQLYLQTEDILTKTIRPAMESAAETLKIAAERMGEPIRDLENSVRSFAEEVSSVQNLQASVSLLNQSAATMHTTTNNIQGMTTEFQGQQNLFLAHVAAFDQRLHLITTRLDALGASGARIDQVLTSNTDFLSRLPIASGQSVEALGASATIWRESAEACRQGTEVWRNWNQAINDSVIAISKMAQVVENQLKDRDALQHDQASMHQILVALSAAVDTVAQHASAQAEFAAQLKQLPESLDQSMREAIRVSSKGAQLSEATTAEVKNIFLGMEQRMELLATEFGHLRAGQRALAAAISHLDATLQPKPSALATALDSGSKRVRSAVSSLWNGKRAK